MAVTSLWHVKGSIKDVIDYIENPEKTVPKYSGLDGAFLGFSITDKPYSRHKRSDTSLNRFCSDFE